MNTEDRGTEEGTNVYDSLGRKLRAARSGEQRESNSSRRRRIRIGPRGSRDRFSLACIFCLMKKEERGRDVRLCVYVRAEVVRRTNDYAIVSTTASAMTADEDREVGSSSN